jgi:hypothetical protein
VEHPEPALELLKKIFKNANDTQKRDGISLWIDQVLALMEVHRARALRTYLALRKQLFVHDSRSMLISLNALRALGEDREILAHCQDFTESCFFALRRTGHLKEAVDQFGGQISSAALAASFSLYGEYEKILAMESTTPARKALALTRLGRAHDAIRLYPDHAACAYLALERYEELLKRFPTHDRRELSRTYALVALNRSEEIDTLLDDPNLEWQWFPAQLYLRPESILSSQHPEAQGYQNRARLLIAMQMLFNGKKDQATKLLSELERVSDPDFWWTAHTSCEILIAILVRYFLLGDTTAFEDDMNKILKDCKENDKQVLWHDAAYLTGNATLSEYKRQPRKAFITERIIFIQTVKLEMEGKTAKANTFYQQVADTTRYDDDSFLLQQRFSQWRLQDGA